MSKFIEKYFIPVVITLVIFFYIIFKLTIGEINIETSHSFNNPMYKLYINNALTAATAEIKEVTTLIPYTINRVKYARYLYGDLINHVDFYPDLKINIKGYYCYSDENLKNKIPCNTNQESKYVDDIDNIVIDKMTIYNQILKGWNEDYIIYDGDYINDLKKVIDKKGNYTVVIKLHHGKIKTVFYTEMILE